MRRLLLRVKGGLVGEFVFVFHGRPPVEEPKDYHIVLERRCSHSVGNSSSNKRASNWRMPLARAPANNAVQRGAPDWYLSALQAGMRRVPAGLAPLGAS